MRPKNPETSIIAKMGCETTSDHPHYAPVHVDKVSQIYYVDNRTAAQTTLGP